MAETMIIQMTAENLQGWCRRDMAW